MNILEKIFLVSLILFINTNDIAELTNGIGWVATTTIAGVLAGLFFATGNNE